jgi:chromosome segregation ATPase
VNTKELYNKGAASILQFKTHELELERSKQKVTTLEQELESKSDGKESVSERIQRLRNKMEDILETQKPAPEVNH